MRAAAEGYTPFGSSFGRERGCKEDTSWRIPAPECGCLSSLVSLRGVCVPRLFFISQNVISRDKKSRQDIFHDGSLTLLLFVFLMILYLSQSFALPCPQFPELFFALFFALFFELFLLLFLEELRLLF